MKRIFDRFSGWLCEYPAEDSVSASRAGIVAFVIVAIFLLLAYAV